MAITSADTGYKTNEKHSTIVGINPRKFRVESCCQWRSITAWILYYKCAISIHQQTQQRNVDAYVYTQKHSNENFILAHPRFFVKSTQIDIEEYGGGGGFCLSIFNAGDRRYYVCELFGWGGGYIWKCFAASQSSAALSTRALLLSLRIFHNINT